MSTSLPQEVQTSKVTTLPDDLKAIAEAMLGDKFGVKEVIPERDDHFRQEYSDGQAWRTGAYESPSVGVEFESPDARYGRGEYGDIKFEIRPWDHHRTAKVKIHHPSYSGIKEAAMRLRRGNLPLNRADIILGPSYWNYIRTSNEFEGEIRFSNRNEGDKPVVAQLYGMDIIVHPAIQDGYIEVVF